LAFNILLLNNPGSGMWMLTWKKMAWSVCLQKWVTG